MSGAQRIRLAIPDDADQLGAIEAASYAATYRGILPDSVLARATADALVERVRARLETEAAGPLDARRRRWVIEDGDGAVRGYASTEPASDQFLPPPAGAAEIESLYLHPDAIGQGYGRALLDHVVDDLVAHGFDPLLLWAFERNERARRFYERAGWTLDVQGEDWVLDGVPCPIVRYRRGP